MEQITLSESGMLQKRWETQEGQLALKDVLSQRFFLSSEQKITVCNRQDLINDLRGVNLSFLELKNFLLFDTDIRWANFAHSTVTGPFQDTDLSFSNFEHASFVSTEFWNAVMAQCAFDNASFRESRFLEVDIRDSTFTNVMFESTEFSHSDLRGTNFEGARFKDCVFYVVKFDANQKNAWAKYSTDECRFEKVEWL
jgi:uncharacterized protein YjbI with pentapeptide repeats